MTRVMFLLDSLGGGGAERSTAALLPHLLHHGVDPSVVMLYRASDSAEADVSAAGIRVDVLAASTFAGRVRELHRMIRDGGIDVVHTALYAADQLGRLAALGTHARVVSSLVTVPRRDRLGGRQIPRWKTLPYDAFDTATGFLCVDRFHAVTHGVAEASAAAHQAPRSRIVVVERGRDPARLGEPSERRRQAAREMLGIPDDAAVVIGVGRQEPEKDFVTLVKAVAEVSADGRPLHLILAGRNAADTTRIERAVAAADLQASSVHLLGHRDDVGDLLAASDVFALSSSYEGAAGVVLEAMQLQVPIVSTSVQGLDGVLLDGSNALTVGVGSPGEMAEAIRCALDDQQATARRVERALNDFEDRFTIARAAERMSELYRSLLDGRDGRPLSSRQWSRR